MSVIPYYSELNHYPYIAKTRLLFTVNIFNAGWSSFYSHEMNVFEMMKIIFSC